MHFCQSRKASGVEDIVSVRTYAFLATFTGANRKKTRRP